MLSQHYPLRQVCRVLSYPRSSFYYQAQATDETALQVAIERLAGEWPTYGYRRITAMLKREGIEVNHKYVARLMQAMGLQGQRPKRHPHTTDSAHAYPRYPNLVQSLTIERPDHVWVGDITYVALRSDFVYLAVLMDVYTRCIRGWHLARHLDHGLTLTALQRALSRHQPEIHHSDQGVQYAATAYIQALHDRKVLISMAAVGEPTQNGYAERLMRTIKEEEVTLHEYADFHDAYQHLGRFLDEVYQHKRIHSALGYLTPVEFEAQWRQQYLAADLVKLSPS
jgi:putative transposase